MRRELTRAVRRFRPAILVSLVLVAITLPAFWSCLDNGFVNFDDDVYVSRNPRVLGGLTAEDVRWAWTALHAGNWHPLTWWSLQADAQFSHDAPRGYHLTNVLLHSANVVLLFLALRRLTGALWRSALVAALFALHPLHVESVAWISERKDVLSTFFALLTLLAYARYAERPGPGRYALVVIPFALGLLAKPMLVTLPFVLLLLDYWPLGRTAWRRQVIEKVPLLFLSAVSCAVTWMAQHEGGAIQSARLYPFDARLGNALVACCAYLGKVLWPVHLAALYPHPGAALPWWKAVTAGVFLVAVSAIVWAGRRRFPYLAVGWLWYVGMLVPVIGLVQVGAQAMADRYMYLPMVGVLIAGVWGAADVADHFRLRTMAAGLAAALLVACAVLTHAQVRYWHDSITLWQHALRVNDRNAAAHFALGEALQTSNRDEDVHAAVRHYEKAFQIDRPLFLANSERAAVCLNTWGVALLQEGRVEAAVQRFKESIRLKPDFALSHNNLGKALWMEGNLDAAVREFNESLRIGPTPMAHANLGLALVAQGKLDEGIDRLTRALEADPNNAIVHRELAAALARRQKVGEALAHFRRALELDPKDSQARRQLASLLAANGKWQEAETNYRAALTGGPDDVMVYIGLANLLAGQGKGAEAAAALREAVALQPEQAQWRVRLASLLRRLGDENEALRQEEKAFSLDPAWPAAADREARRIATAPESKPDQVAWAAELSEEVCAATGRKDARFLDTLAAAYAAAGQYPRAAATAREALGRAADKELARQIEGRIRLYEQGRPGKGGKGR